MRWAAKPLLLVALAACAVETSPSGAPSPTTEPSPSAEPSRTAPHSRTPEASPTAESSPSPTAAALDIPEPGLPHDAADVLDAMRASRRPGGVPDQLETEVIAAAVAERLWTLDGQPWPELVVGGSCGPALCTLEVAGTPPGALGEDLYVFSVDLASSAVELMDASLRGLSAGLALQLDEVARAIASNELLNMQLTSVRWLPPPDAGTFVIAYRTGGEEGSCGLDVRLDATIGTIADLARRNC